MSLEESIKYIDELTAKLKESFRALQTKEREFLEREASIENRLKMVIEQEDELKSYKKVSWCNQLYKQLDDLKNQNKLLTKSNDVLKKNLREKGCSQTNVVVEDSSIGSNIEDTYSGVSESIGSSENAHPIDVKLRNLPDELDGNVNGGVVNEDDEDDEDDEDGEDELSEIIFKGIKYNTDSEYLYDMGSGDAIGYKHKASFRLYKSKGKQ